MKICLTAALMLSVATVASAHSTLEQKEAAVGATTKITLRVPHGCDGQATHTVRVDLPEGVYSAQPMPKAGWTLDTVTGAYATPYDNHGTEMTEGVRQITWSGGNLEDAWYDEFTFRAAIGADLEPGTTLYFPAMQECADGTADWTDTSGAADVPNPAPSLMLVAGDTGHDAHGGHGGHDAMAADMADAQTYQVGDLTLTAPFSRATLPNAPVAGGFLTITNTGTTDDRLIAASAAVAGTTEVHEMSMDGDVMRMRELADGLPIPAGETVTLEPGGFHLMFMDLQQPLVEGETVAVTLTFETAGTVEVTMPIGASNAAAGGHDAHAGHGN